VADDVVAALANDGAVGFLDDGTIALVGLVALGAQLIEMARTALGVDRRIGNRRPGRMRRLNLRRRSLRRTGGGHYGRRTRVLAARRAWPRRLIGRSLGSRRTGMDRRRGGGRSRMGRRRRGSGTGMGRRCGGGRSRMGWRRRCGRAWMNRSRGRRMLSRRRGGGARGALARWTLRLFLPGRRRRLGLGQVKSRLKLKRWLESLRARQLRCRHEGQHGSGKYDGTACHSVSRPKMLDRVVG